MVDIDNFVEYQKRISNMVIDEFMLFERNKIIDAICDIMATVKITNYKLVKKPKSRIDFDNELKSSLLRKCHYFEFTFFHEYQLKDYHDQLIPKIDYINTLNDHIELYEYVIEDEQDEKDVKCFIKHQSSYIDDRYSDTTIVDIYIQPDLQIDKTSDVLSLLSNDTIGIIHLLSLGILQSIAYK